MVQAVGGSMLNPVAMSIITNTFTDPRERARAIGVWGGVVGISMALGPGASAARWSTAVGWRSIFWVNIPVGLAAIVLTALLRARVAGAARRAGSTRSARCWSSSLLAPLTYGDHRGPGRGWASPLIIGCFVVGRGAALAPARRTSRAAIEPLIDLRFFRSAPFSGATLIAVCAFAALGGFLFLNTLYLQDVRGYSRPARRPVHAADGRR